MHADRLRLLAAHLRKPARERLHYRFDFKEPNCGVEKERKGVKNCGSAGCAMGETPLLFPDQIKFNSERIWNFDISTGISVKLALPYWQAAVELFDICESDAFALFSPGSRRWWARRWLEGDATARQVADSIDAYVDAVEQGRSIP